MSRERDEEYESRFLATEQLNELDELMNEYDTKRLVYNPSSIWHGSSIFLQTETLLRMEISRMQDFIGFLFEEEDYCGHTSESEAWDEFHQKEYSELLNPQPHE